LRVRIKDLATRHRRFGLPRLHAMLKREGLVKNRKRTHRIYSREKLQVRMRRRKKLARVPRVARPQASRPNEVWSIDFVFDWLLTRRRLKCLTVVDDFTKESVGLLVSHSISGAEVARFLASLAGPPERIRSDNGPEFGSNAFLDWIESTTITHEFITPGKPNENAFIESFNSRFRDECLNEHVFRNLNDARQKIEVWRHIYNNIHPHSSLGMLL
jgi:putative transposase